MISETLKIKVFKAYDEMDFVGNMVYTEEEYKQLLDYTSSYSKSYICGIGTYLNGDDKIHFATLVEIAKRWKFDTDDNDDESRFWVYVFKTIIGKSDNTQKLYKAYIEVINGLSSKIEIVKEGNRYYATLMMHAFAPYKSMSAFFDLAYNVYKRELSYNYAETDNYICAMITDAFCAVVNNNTDEKKNISLGSSSYGIKIGLRRMALGENTKINFIDLLNKVLLYINKLAHYTVFEVKDYISTLVKKWWDKKIEKDMESYTYDKTETPTTKFNIKVKFVQNSDGIYLRISPILLTEPDLVIEIYLNGKDKRISENIFTVSGEIYYKSVQWDFPLDELLRGNTEIDLTVILKEHGEQIFEKRFIKNFILFDGKNELQKNILQCGNYFLYTLKPDYLCTPRSIGCICANLYSIYPTDGEILSDGKRQLIFIDNVLSVQNAETDIIGKINNCAWEFEQKVYAVFSDKVILITKSDMSINGVEFCINDRRGLLSDLSGIIEDEYLTFDISEFIPKGVPCELSVYSRINNKSLANEKIIRIPGLKLQFSERIYYGNGNYKLKVSVGEKYKTFTWNLGDDKIVCSICHGKLNITIPQIKWKLDDEEWNYGSDESIIWYENRFDSGSLLDIVTEGKDEIKLYCNVEGHVEPIKRNLLSNKFEIGRFIYSNKGKRELLFFFKLNNENFIRKLFIVATKEYFTQIPPFVTDNETLRFVGDKYYIGKQTEFNICLKRVGQNDITVKTCDLVDGMIRNVKQGIYWIKVFVKTNGSFISSEKIIWEGECVFGDRDKIRLADMVLKINPIKGVGDGDFWKSRIKGYYLTDFKRSGKEDEYFAKLHFKNAAGEKSLIDDVEDCRIEIISDEALQITVKNNDGGYVKLKCNENLEIKDPKSNAWETTNYKYIEVTNV